MKIYKIPQNLKTIIFDIDSTLYTHEFYAQNQLDVLIKRYGEEVGLTEQDAQDKVAAYRKDFAQKNGGKKVSLGNTLLSFGIPIEQTIIWRNELMHPENFLSPDTKLQETMKILSEKYSIICVTNNPVKPARKTLDVLGVSPFIPDVIGIDLCKVSKPAKEPFLLATQKTRSIPEECLAVGDRYDIDVALPLSLGMGGIVVSGVEDVYKFPGIL